jgi:hypothetical protein
MPKSPQSMIDDQYRLATNPETAPEILRELSQSDDRAIRQAVAGNPNVPIDILWEIILDFPQAVVDNPVFEWLTLENPNWIIDIPERTLFELFQQANLPDIFFSEIAKPGKDRARQMRNSIWHHRINEIIADHAKTSTSFLNYLANSQYGSVRAHLANRNDLTKELLIKLAIDSHPTVRNKLLANSHIDPTILAELTTHPDPKVSQLAQQHPNTAK